MILPGDLINRRNIEELVLTL